MPSDPMGSAAIRPLSRCLDCDAAIMSGAAEKPCPVSGGAHRWDHGRPATAATDVPWALYEAMKRRVDQALHLIQSFDPTSGTDRARVFVDDLRHVLEGTGGD